MLTSNTIHSIYLGTGFWFIVLAVAYWKVFTKAGVAGWKGIIPIINMYTRYKLVWEVKMFWIAILMAALAGLLPGEKGFILPTLRAAASIAFLVINVKSLARLSRAFGHGKGFTAGLFFLEPIFALILGFGGSEFEGAEEDD